MFNPLDREKPGAMDRRDIGQRNGKNASEMDEKKAGAKGKVLLLPLQMRVAETDKNRVRNYADRRQPAEQRCRVRGAGQQQNIHAHQAGEEHEPSEKMAEK